MSKASKVERCHQRQTASTRTHLADGLARSLTREDAAHEHLDNNNNNQRQNNNNNLEMDMDMAGLLA